MQNYPNPFNPETNIKFDIPQSSNVIVKIFDIKGSEITTLINQKLIAGSYKTFWNGANYPSGIYFCRITAGDYQKTIKMTLIKY